MVGAETPMWPSAMTKAVGRRPFRPKLTDKKMQCGPQDDKIIFFMSYHGILDFVDGSRADS
jgi:hypothetical protein